MALKAYNSKHLWKKVVALNAYEGNGSEGQRESDGDFEYPWTKMVALNA